MENEMETAVEELPDWTPHICALGNHTINGFMVFRENDRAPNWGGGKTISTYCLDCAKHLRQVDKLLDGMGLY